MRQAILKLAGIAAVSVVMAGPAAAETVELSVSTDKAVYLEGESVNWTVQVRTSADIANLGLTLTDPAGGAFGTATFGSDFGADNGFNFNSTGLAGQGTLVDFFVAQLIERVSVPEIIDNEVVFATGSYLAGALGSHELSLTVETATYWLDGVNSGNVETVSVSSAATFQVIPEPAMVGLLGAALPMALLRRRLRITA